MEYKYYILSKAKKHALGVVEETDRTITIQKLKAVKKTDEFSGGIVTDIVADNKFAQTNNATVDKDALSKKLGTVELTKDYWVVYEYLTGIKRRSVAQSTES